MLFLLDFFVDLIRIFFSVYQIIQNGINEHYTAKLKKKYLNFCIKIEQKIYCNYYRNIL